ncbi:MAG: hypothetical protein QF911_01750 [Candidatus Thalassarchaeaceae archaeon]|jgi:hypothetical protein|nr:hypothetical protein [Candidatus Thalassarchaeaceae archaeon]
MTDGHGKRIVTKSWISDTPDEVEHPPIPLGLNRMAVPRAAIVLSIATFFSLVLSAIWVGLSTVDFLENLEDSFGSSNVELLELDGRWVWEVDLLFDTCSAREDNWDWPDSLADQDDVFLYPGELRCDWEHQGVADAASVVIYNRGNETLDLVMEITGGGVVFDATSEPHGIINGLEAGDSIILQISLTEDVVERAISITATHISVLQAQVRLDVQLFKGSEGRQVHIQEGEAVEVHYTVWNADTDEELDDGTWVDRAGDPWWSIDGFGWSAIGLDIDNDRGGGFPIIDTGTTHVTLLPPPIAYGNSEDHELQYTWLRFELKLERAPISD